MRIALGVAAVAAAGIGTSTFVRGTLGRYVETYFSRRAVRQLADVVGRDYATRPVEGRLSGGFHYAPAAAWQPGTTPSPDLTIALAVLEKAFNSSDSTVNAAGAGVAWLVAGNVDRAIDALEAATLDDPTNADYQNDLSAAYLERASRTDRLDYLPRAIAAAERAIQSRPDAEEAWFNLALALEKVGLRLDASAWAEAEKRQADLGWRAEAQRKRTAFLGPVAARDWEGARAQILEAAAGKASHYTLDSDYREQAREWVEDVALPSWGAAYAAGDAATADHRFWEARTVARWLVDVHGDTMPRAGVESIDRLLKAGQHKGVRSLALAHVALGRAYADTKANQVLKAADDLRQVVTQFEAGSSPYGAWAAIYGAVADRTRADNQAAARQLALIPARDLVSFRYLRARAAWLYGLIDISAGRLDEAGREYRSALDDLVAGGETDGVAAMRSVIAEQSFYVGDSQLAWHMARDALVLVDSTRSLDRRELTLVMPGLLASWQDLPEAALHFDSAYVNLARREHDVTGLAEALVRRAEIYDRLGFHDRAAADLRAAQEELPQIPDPARRERRANELRVVAGVVEGRTDPLRGRVELTRALDFFESGGFSLRAVRLHLTRGRLAREAGFVNDARADYMAGIDEFERQRRGWTVEQTRLSSFDEAWSLFEEMVGLEGVKGSAHADAALEIAERGRAQTLLDSIHGSMPGRRSLVQIRNELPADVDVLFYSTLEKELLIWRVGREGSAATSVNVDRATLERRIARFTSSIEKGNLEEVRVIGRDLYSILIAPVNRSIDDDKALVVIGDGVIQRVPFAALVTDDGHYLIEKRPIAWSPSLSVYVSSRAPETGSLGTTLVVVPPTDSIEGVMPLPAALTEGRDVAHRYSRSDLLTGDRADVTGFLAAARDARIVHFAGHSVVNPQYPSLSYLQLAGGTSASGRLRASTDRGR